MGGGNIGGGGIGFEVIERGRGNGDISRHFRSL